VNFSGFSYYTLDVFADGPLAGNPLAVVLPAAEAPTALLQRIAAELALSETAFLYLSPTSWQQATMRIFTPTMELSFAGHPTIGTAALLFLLSGAAPGQARSVTLAQRCGEVHVTGAVAAAGAATAELTLPAQPELTACAFDNAFLAQLLNLPAGAIGFQGYASALVKAGPSFLFVPLASLSDLYAAELDLPTWNARLKGTAAENVYLFAHEGGTTFHARMFGPAMGQVEDAGTGSAAGGLGAYLNERRPAFPSFDIRQGVKLGRSSRLGVRTLADAAGARPIAVAGRAVLIAKGQFVPLALPEGSAPPPTITG
jgi:trans-2,3-dihydro-3-hydroxyanthranilate isomerase